MNKNIKKIMNFVCNAYQYRKLLSNMNFEHPYIGSIYEYIVLLYEHRVEQELMENINLLELSHACNNILHKVNPTQADVDHMVDLFKHLSESIIPRTNDFDEQNI